MCVYKVCLDSKNKDYIVLMSLCKRIWTLQPTAITSSLGMFLDKTDILLVLYYSASRCDRTSLCLYVRVSIKFVLTMNIRLNADHVICESGDKPYKLSTISNIKS